MNWKGNLLSLQFEKGSQKEKCEYTLLNGKQFWIIEVVCNLKIKCKIIIIDYLTKKWLLYQNHQ